MRGLTKMEKQAIERKAYELLRAGNVDLTSPVDVIQLAKNLGFAVGNIVSKENYEGVLLINENDNNILGSNSSRVIGVDAKQDFNKKRFIIAHELGHYTINYNGDPIFARRDRHCETNRSDEENEIDFFAACLLMPKEGFVAEYRKLKEQSEKNIIKKLAELFKVPEESAMRRLQELDLVELK